MSTMNRIVLLNCQGEELFSGDSLLSEPPPPPTLPREELATEETSSSDEEPIPETLRSSVLLRAHEPVSRPIIVEDAELGHRAA
jgi:hypothetical protein